MLKTAIIGGLQESPDEWEIILYARESLHESILQHAVDIPKLCIFSDRLPMSGRSFFSLQTKMVKTLLEFAYIKY